VSQYEKSLLDNLPHLKEQLSKQSKEEIEEEINTYYKEEEKNIRIGFLAQEVQKASINNLYNLVQEGEGGRLQIDYASFVLPLINAVKELDARLEIVENKLNLNNKLI
jgi:hypothetical protein